MTERITCPVFEHAAKNGGQSAVINKDRSLSCQQLAESVDLAAEKFQRLGVKPRERVALVSTNSIEYVIALFALWRQGTVVCLLSTRLPEEGTRACLQNISCVKSVTGTNFLKKSVPVTDFVTDFDLNAPADIMFTSGSSGVEEA